MLRDDLITLVLDRCGRRSGSQIWIDHAQAELLRAQDGFEAGCRHPIGNGVFWPWFLLSTLGETLSPSQDEKVDVPEGLLAEPEDGALWIRESVDEDWQELEKDSYDSLRRRFDLTPGRPTTYALTNRFFRLGPIPDKQYELQIVIYRADAKLTSNIENKWTVYAEDLMIAELGHLISAYYLYNEQMAAKFAQDRERALMRLYTQSVERDLSNRVMSMGPD